MPRILIIDHDPHAWTDIITSLKDSDCHAVVVDNLEEAYEQIMQHDYAVAVAEITMGGCQGSQIVDILKSYMPRLEVVVTAAQSSLDEVIACMRAGAGDFFIKPLNIEQVYGTIKTLMQKMETSQEHVKLRMVNEMKDKFLTLVSHELRTPLTLVYGYISILYRQRALLTEEQCDLVNIVLKSTKQLIDIVNNIQIITRAEEGDIVLHLQPVLPYRLLMDVLAEMKASSQQRNLSMRMMEECRELEAIQADSIRLRQVVMEVIQNAIRNTPDGGEIVVGVRKDDDNHLVFWIKDNGIGIPTEEQAKIFQGFYKVADVQLHSSHQSRFGSGGLGIGMTLVKAVVEAHQGHIRLKSSPGAGTLVEIRIPYSQQPPQGPPPELGQARSLHSDSASTASSP